MVFSPEDQKVDCETYGPITSIQAYFRGKNNKVIRFLQTFYMVWPHVCGHCRRVDVVLTPGRQLCLASAPNKQFHAGAPGRAQKRSCAADLALWWTGSWSLADSVSAVA